MITLLFALWFNIGLSPCDRVPVGDIVITEEQDARVYTMGDREIVVTDEYRFYRTTSPYLALEHNRLSMIARNLQQNNDSYRLFLEASITRPSWCDLPPSKPRA